MKNRFQLQQRINDEWTSTEHVGDSFETVAMVAATLINTKRRADRPKAADFRVWDHQYDEVLLAIAPPEFFQCGKCGRIESFADNWTAGDICTDCFDTAMETKQAGEQLLLV